MEGFEGTTYTNKYQRDENFYNLRNSSFSFPNERQVVKWSDVEPLFVSGTTQPLLDEKGRRVYASVFCLAYPKDIHGHRARRRAKQAAARAVAEAEADVNT